MAFDPLDTKYQKSPDFSPDKSDKWPFPAEQDGWMLAHNAIRMEMEKMIEALEASQKRAGAIQRWEAACIKRVWKVHHTHIHSHHSNEDAMLTPFLEERINYPEKLTADHTDLIAKLDRVSSVVESIGEKEGDSVDELLKELKEYQDLMLPHLKEEEEMGLPLSRAYFEPHEIGAVTQKIVSGSPKVEMGSFIICQGVDEFRNGFMPRHNIPSFVWYIQFKSQAAEFEKEFTKPIEALKTGVELPPDGSCCTIQ